MKSAPIDPEIGEPIGQSNVDDMAVGGVEILPNLKFVQPGEGKVELVGLRTDIAKTGKVLTWVKRASQFYIKRFQVFPWTQALGQIFAHRIGGQIAGAEHIRLGEFRRPQCREVAQTRDGICW